MFYDDAIEVRNKPIRKLSRSCSFFKGEVLAKPAAAEA